MALLSFGGPTAQIAVMHRIIVDEKHWISESRFLYALNYCMLLPGPEAKQLAVYIGWLMHRTLGGIVAGSLFVAPGIISIMALSYVYAIYGKVPVVVALFFGLKAAVLAIVVEAVVRIGKRALKNNALRLLAAAAFIGIFFFNIPFPVIILGAAAIGFLGAASGAEVFKSDGGHGKSADKHDEDKSLLGDELPQHARPSVARASLVSAVWLALWLIPVIALLATLGNHNVFSNIAVFFSKMAVVPSAAPMLCWLTSRRARSSNMAGSSPGKCWMSSAWPRQRRDRSSWFCNSWASWRLTAIPVRYRH